MLAEAKGVSFNLKCAKHLGAGIDSLVKGGIDAVLVDLDLPDSSGLKTFLRVQAHAADVPVLVLADLRDEATGLRSVSRGAQNCLVKERLNSDLLTSAVRHAVQRKRLEEKLRRSQLFIERVVDAIPDILYVYDLKERRITYVNHQVYKTLGYTVKEIYEMESGIIGNLIHPGDHDPALRHMKKVEGAGDGEVIECKYRIRHAEGEWRWLHSREVVFERDPSGAAIKCLGVAEDITQR